MGGVGREGVGFLEGEGGGENNASDGVEDEVNDGEGGDVIKWRNGKENGSNGKEVARMEGTVNDDDFEEAVEEEEGEGGGDGGESDVEYIAEEHGKRKVVGEKLEVGDGEEESGAEEAQDGREEEFRGLKGEGRGRGFWLGGVGFVGFRVGVHGNIITCRGRG